MNPSGETTDACPVQAEPDALVSGDRHWAQQAPRWHERELAMPWPPELLQDFCLRMAQLGMCVSRPLMMCDRRYALQQLADAHKLDDDRLKLMAVQLFRHFEARQSGIAAVH